MEKKIKVLWVEDEEENYDSYKNEAYKVGIELFPFKYWEEAYFDLTSNYNNWDAIILDAICKVSENDIVSANKFLSRVLSDLKRLKENNRNRIIPWFILSGGTELQLNDLIDAHNEDRIIWDYTWKNDSQNKNHKNYYSKLLDRKVLFERIAKIVPNFVVNYQIRFEYADILNSLETDLQNKIIDLIHEIIYKSNQTNDLLFNGMRKIIEEFVYPKMEKLGFFSGIPDTLKTMNGKSIFFENQYKDKYLHIVRALHTVVQVTQNGSHRNEKSTIAKTVSKGNAPYLLRSCLYELLNIIYWLNQEERMNLRT